ncbi:MAG: hypothetical protein ABSE73_14745 [Planctomycetota bacterium]
MLFAVLSYASVIGFVQTMAYMEHHSLPDAVQLATLLGGLLLFSAQGFVLYRIGVAAEYWSPAVKKGWRRAGRFVVVVFAFGLVALALALILPLILPLILQLILPS